MTLTLICNLDMRTRPRFFSNLRNYQTESRYLHVFKLSCGHTHTHLYKMNHISLYACVHDNYMTVYSEIWEKNKRSVRHGMPPSASNYSGTALGQDGSDWSRDRWPCDLGLWGRGACGWYGSSSSIRTPSLKFVGLNCRSEDMTHDVYEH